MTASLASRPSPYYKSLLLIVVFSPLFAQDISAQCLARSFAEPTLAGDWATVARVIEADSRNASSLDVTQSLVLGHAYTALNKNNDALEHYASARATADLVTFEEFAQCLVNYAPRSASALFLAGDAAARLGRAEDAVPFFTRSLAQDPNFVLALLGRGAVRLATGNSDAALIDFDLASKTAPGLAEAWASLGTYWVHEEVSPAALVALERALHVNPEMAIAYLGRAVVSYASGDFERARRDLFDSQRLAPQLSVIVEDDLSALAKAEVDLARDYELNARVGVTVSTSVASTDMAPSLDNGPLSLFNTAYAKAWYDQQSSRALASATGSGIGAGLVASGWDIVGGYIPGKPANEGQARAQVMWSLSRVFTPAGVGTVMTGASSVINSAEGNLTQAALDISGLGGKYLVQQSSRTLETPILSKGSLNGQLELSFVDRNLTTSAEARRGLGETINGFTNLRHLSKAAELTSRTFSSPPVARPGGVSFADFARAWVDRGGWPLRTRLTFTYPSGLP